jgi:putative transposase
MFAAEIRRNRGSQMRAYANWQWHPDGVLVKINGARYYLRRAVDYEGEVLESLVTSRRDKKAAVKFLGKAMRKHGPQLVFVTDRLRSDGAALLGIGATDRQETGRWLNNRAENSHLPFRRRVRAMLRFRRLRSLRKFAAVHTSISNHFNQERGLSGRDIFRTYRSVAPAEWRQLGVAWRDAPLIFRDWFALV